MEETTTCCELVRAFTFLRQHKKVLISQARVKEELIRQCTEKWLMVRTPTTAENNMKIICFLGAILLFGGCIEAGTHGSIRGYSYTISKSELEKKIHFILKSSTNIWQDSAKDYYNDDSTYIRMNINYDNHIFSYIFSFYGDRTYWDTSTKSQIFIAYASNDKGEGGSEGDGGVKNGNSSLRHELLIPFENVFIAKLDSILFTVHFVED